MQADALPSKPPGKLFLQKQLVKGRQVRARGRPGVA